MKIILTKNEMKVYFDCVKKVCQGMNMSEQDIESAIEIAKVTIKEGIKEGSVSITLNHKGNLICEISEQFVIKITNLYGRYLMVVIPQVMSIYNLTKQLVDDIEDAMYPEPIRPIYEEE